MSRLDSLRAVAKDELDVPLFNQNFRNIMLLDNSEFNELTMIGPVLTHNLKIMLQQADLELDDVEYAIATQSSVTFVFKNESSYTVKLEGTGFTYMSTSSAVMTWARIQKLYYDDIKHLANHSKRAPNGGRQTLTLDQLLDKRKQNGRLVGSLRKSRQVKGK